MCGIAGILGTVNDTNRTALGRMAAAMRHRGPDGGGTWISSVDEQGRGCLLAHRRLSILDLSESANQPMIEPVSGRVVVFNGEIYNYRKLRSDLEAEGRHFSSTGDTEVLLTALATWGSAAIPKLRGMFAFGLWNPSRRSLLLARDPLGIKPLYLARNPDSEGDWTLAFASELRAILASKLLGRPPLNPSAVSGFIWNGFVPGPMTMVQGVSILEPGEVHEVDNRGRTVLVESSWVFPAADGLSADEEEVREALAESVRSHLVSDVPLGAFLSSGIDSSVVANLARGFKEPVHTFTLSFEEPEFDEGPAARRIADAMGTQHREVRLTESDFVARLDDALQSLDQPTFDGLNTYYMSRAVREAGLRVALVGTGGDELFGGYRSFQDLPLLHRWLNRTSWIPGPLKERAAALAAATIGPQSRGSIRPQMRWAKLPSMVRTGGDLLRLYQLSYALFLPELQRELLLMTADLEMICGLPPTLAARLNRETQDRTTLASISIMEQRCFLGERLLRDADVAGMAASIEIRLPLVDREVVACVSRLPDDIRYKPLGRKSSLRRTGLLGLDPALFERPKRGFVLPFDRWIRRSLGPTIDELMRDRQSIQAVGLDCVKVGQLWEAFQNGSPGLYWSRVWAIFVFLHWCQSHGLKL